MIEALTSFDQALPKLSQQVRILDKQGGWISLTPLTAQPEPQNLRRLKGEITKRWGVTSLLDILKEADLGVITFFRTLFPAKACQGEKKLESFPLSQNKASPQANPATTLAHEACVC